MVIELRHQQHEIGWLKGDREECKAALQTFSDFLEMKAEATDAEQDRRRAQSGAEPEGDAGYVHIFKRRMSSPHLSGRVDESNGGRRLLKARQRRRAQQNKGSGTCPETTELQSKCGSTF